MSTAPTTRPMSLLAIWNMSFGFLGIQFGWGLQMANMSAIYQYLGATESELPLLWLAAPLTGLIVQPIIGYYSDRTWTRLGRRRPYFLVGAILASLALIAMPNSSTLWMAAGLLWVLDASVNISMEPFRAFVGDLLPPTQRQLGFAMQSLLIGLGAFLSSMLPLLLTTLGIANKTSGNAIPQSVHLAFYIGAGIFLAAVVYTIITTKEHPPETEKLPPGDPTSYNLRPGPASGLIEIFRGIGEMPLVMRRLAVVQFFTWLGLFCMWIYFTPAIARSLYQAEPNTPRYQQAVEWGGFCFGIYSIVAFAVSFLLVALTKAGLGAKTLHRASLLCAAAGLLTVTLWPTPKLLLVSMVGVGIGWASILSMPYAMLANAIPPARMGFFMGVFNLFIVIPQILASTLLGPVVKNLLHGNAATVVTAGGACFVLAATALSFVPEQSEK